MGRRSWFRSYMDIFWVRTPEPPIKQLGPDPGQSSLQVSEFRKRSYPIFAMVSRIVPIPYTKIHFDYEIQVLCPFRDFIKNYILRFLLK